MSSVCRVLPFVKSSRPKHVTAIHSLLVTSRQLSNRATRTARGGRGAITIRDYDPYSYRWQKRFFSSPSSNNSSNDSNNSNSNNDGNNDNDSNDKEEDISPIFPWRENATTPLKRLAMKDDLSGIGSDNRASSFFKKVMSAIELKEFGLLSFFITKTWEKQLSSNAAWAFQVAVCSLVYRRLGIPTDQIKLSPESGIFIDAMTDINEQVDADADVAKSCDEESERAENTDIDASEQDDEEVDEDQMYASEFMRGMIEENFLSLYKPLASRGMGNDSGNDNGKYHLTLALKPIASRLEHIFVVPGFTRQDVNNNPSLKGAYRAIEKAYAEKASLDTIQDMSKELLQKTAHYGHKRSIIMDVSIDCMEIFQVRDLSSGGDDAKVVQGQDKKGGDADADDAENESESEMPQAQMTTHLVRFEMVTSKGQNMADRVIGSWYIIDIDDIMSGNIWH